MARWSRKLLDIYLQLQVHRQANAAVPRVYGISPDNGTAAGGDSVVITGTNFTGATAVVFGATDAPGLTVDSDTQITATTPAHVAGMVVVGVTTGKGASTSGPMFTFS
jgi:hypothetical protein